MRPLAIFTLNGCVHCAELKKKLKEQGISFHDIEITKNHELWESVVAQTGNDILPTVFIQLDNLGNGMVLNPERDFQSIEEVIEKIKNNIEEKGD